MLNASKLKRKSLLGSFERSVKTSGGDVHGKSVQGHALISHWNTFLSMARKLAAISLKQSTRCQV